MPRKGRRSEAQKQRWSKPEASEGPAPGPQPGASPPCSRSPLNKKVGSSLPAGPFWRADGARETFCPRGGTGYRHRVLRWPTSSLTGRSHKLVIPPEVPGKKFVLIVGNSHLRAIVDGFVRMPESRLSFGFLSTCGASASEIRTEVLHAVVPRVPDIVCVMAPGNNLTSTTVDVAGVDFAKLLTSCGNRWSKVFVSDFPPRLAVDVHHQDLLRQEYRRVAARMGVKYFTATEHFPLSDLALWSKDGVHLSDDKGMGILSQLFWSAASQQLETPPPTPRVSPLPPRPVRKVTPKLVVRETSRAPPSPEPRKRRPLVQGGKTSHPPREPPQSRGSPQPRVAHKQEEESFLPLNPVWFSGTALSAMEKVSPSHLSCLADFRLSPKPKKVASSAPKRKRQSRPRDSPPSPVNEVAETPVAKTPPATHSWRSAEDAPVGPPFSPQAPAASAAARPPRTPDGHPPRLPTAALNLLDSPPVRLSCSWGETDTPTCSPIAKIARIVPSSPDVATSKMADVGCKSSSPVKTPPLTPSQTQWPWFSTTASISAQPPTLKQDPAIGGSVDGPRILSVRATHSQGDNRFVSFSRGRQCTCMALTFLAYHNEGLHIDTALLDRVLAQGDALYIGIKEQLVADGTFFNDHLTVEEMPKQVLTEGKIYDVHTSPVRIGHLLPQGGSPRRRMGLPLATQLECLSLDVSHAFLLVAPECIAVFRDTSGRYGLFDSHSRCSAGLPHPDGTAIMCTFRELADMVEHLCRLFKSRGPYATYELVPVIFGIVQSGAPMRDTRITNVSPPSTATNHDIGYAVMEPSKMPLKKKTAVLVDHKAEKHKRRTVTRRKNVDLAANQNKKSRSETLDVIKHRRSQKKTYITKRYKSDAAFQNKQKWYISNRYRTDLAFKNKQKKVVQDRYRTDPDFRNKQRRFVQTSYRADPVFRNKQKKFVQDKYRTDPGYKSRKLQSANERYRTDPGYKSKKLQSANQRYRTDPAVQHKMKTRAKTCAKNAYRTDPTILKKCRDRIGAKYRHNEIFRLQKIKRSAETKRKSRLPKSSHREIPQPLVSEAMKAAILSFQRRIRCGPTYICTVCHRTLFPNQVKQCNRCRYTKNLPVVAECLSGKYVHICDAECKDPCSVPLERMQEWICHTCDRHLTRGHMPSIAAANCLHLASIPPELAELNVLERQLIAKIIPFAKIVALPKGQQRAVHGSVVCVPSEMEATVNALPRPSSGAHLLKVKLKRRIRYKGYQHFYTVNMTNVLAALATLKDTHPDYRDVIINESAIQEDEPAQEEDTLQSEDVDVDAAIGQQASHVGEEHQALRPGLVLDTCMQPPDIAQECLSYGDGIFSIAPAQGNKPVSFFAVPRLEASAFPVLFPTGENTLDEARQVKLSPSLYFNTRLFSVDNRFASDQTYLFFAQFVTETHLATNSMSIQSRKGKALTKDGRSISNRMLQDKEEVEQLIQNKEATRFMQPLRGTPAYWEKSLRDLHAMVRQLGKPTFFLTFSAAEMRWGEVIDIIKAQQGEQGDFSELDWKAKCDILRSNPVTVMRYFEKRVEALMNELILSPAQPIGPVEDFFYRVEFQARGSPHIHMLVWVKDAPEIEDPSCCDDVIAFIDRYISCKLPDETVDPELHKIVKEVQIHSKNHSKSCRKGNVECRFGFPRLPMEKTIITEPPGLDMDDDTNDNGKGGDKKSKKKAKSRLVGKTQRFAKAKLKPIRDLLMDEKASFKDLLELLKACNMTHAEYRHYVNDLTSGMVVVLKRHPQDCWVNGYNPDLLRAWNANMDIQYVLDDFSCIMYMMSYVSKPEHEMTEFLNSVIKEVKKSNVNQADEMKKIMQAYSKHREVSAQESVARTCSLPLRRCSRQVIFINTDEDGVKMSYPMSKLMNMNPNEENIWMSGLPEKYIHRPRTAEFEDMCLAEFVSEFRVLYGLQAEGPNAIPLLKDQGFIQKRTSGKPAIIRFARFNEQKHPEKFYRRLLKLYLPHRRDAELKNSDHPTYRDFYNHGRLGTWLAKRIVDFNQKRYEGQGKKIEKVLEALKAQGPVLNAWNTFAPEVELDRLECVAQREPLDQLEEEDQDVVPCYQIDPSESVPLIQAPKLSPDVVRAMYRSLNEMQASVFYTVRDWCLQRVWGSNPEPFFYFVTGGAGCGKSHVIKCVYQEATKILRQLPRFRDTGDMSQPSVILTAFTGTAAYNISGKTLHSLLKLPRSLKPPYQGLGNALDDVRVVLSNAEILIIDEVSMVSKELFAYVHWRLQQIKGNLKPFGGMSVLAVGDFYQLPPLGRAKPLCVYEANVLDLWRENFQIVNLTEIMRQREDGEFAQLLNRIRVKGKDDSLSEEDKTLLTRAVADAKDCLTDALHIFATNKEVNEHNAAVVATLDADVIDVWAQDHRRDPRTGALVTLKSCLQGKNTELPNKIQAALGVRVMLIRNLDVEDGLVNGTFGTIRKIVTSSGEGLVTVKLIGLELDDQTAGLKKKGKVDNLVYVERFEEQMSRKGVVRRQFPMRLAFGCTSHKVQGMTLKSAVVCLKRIFEPGMAYVALSRTTSLEGLKIIDFAEKKIYADPEIAAAMANMSQASFHSTTPLLHYLTSSRPGATLTIVHHNVEGLPCHIEDTKRHHELRLADVLCLTETHLSGSSVSPDFQLEGYTFFGRNRHVSYTNRVDLATKDGGGVATYCRSSLQPREHRFLQNVTDLEFTVVRVETPVRALIATVYRPPSYELGMFLANLKGLIDSLDVLDCQPIVICGDFNEDLLSPGKKAIKELFESRGYTQLISAPTTEKQTLIDHIYISQAECCVQSGVLQTYYSYHNPVYCVLTV